MRSAVETSRPKPKVSPLAGSGPFRAVPAGASPQEISRTEWWLWLSALLVTVLSAIAFLLSSIHSFFRHADYFYEIRSDQARWATLCLVLLFNGWLVYRQWSLRRLRRQCAGEPLGAQGSSAPATDASGLDPVTGLCTRAALEVHLGKEVARARRQNSALCLATVHLDEYLKLVARCGSSAVDNGLKELARRLKKASRGSDIAARLNDDDFLLVLPECGVNEVKQVLNRLGTVDISSAGERIPLEYTTGWVDYQSGELPASFLKRASDLLHLYDIPNLANISTSLSVR